MEGFIFLTVVGSLLYYINRKRTHTHNIAALNNCVSIMTYDEIGNIIATVTNSYEDIEKHYNYVFRGANIPLGRASAFLNYHGTNALTEDPYLFLCKRSLKDTEFREYGLIVTRNGIYYSEDDSRNAKISDKQKPYPGKNRAIPYCGLVQVKSIGRWLILTYVRSPKKLDRIKWLRIENIHDRTLILDVLNCIIAHNIGLLMLNGNAVESIDEIPFAVEKVFGSAASARKYYEDKTHQSELAIDQSGVDTGLRAAGIQAVQPQINAFYAENKNYMNGARGHGYAAEYGNNAVDRFLMRDVENAAQQLVNGHQAKHGADRIVNGIEIQTKYYQSASETVGAAFSKKTAKYIRADGSGKMMAIEVPRDQYHDALRLMQKRIDNGQVPNVEPGETAENYIRKGHFTYSQSFLIAQSGTVESLTVDIASGVVCCSHAAGITAAISFALAIWNGQSAKEAFNQSMRVGMKVLGQGTFIYALTMQLSRDRIANVFAGKNMVNGIFKGYQTIENPVFTISENLAAKINSSSFSQTALGKRLGANTVSSRQLIGAAVTMAVVFGPDIAKALIGRISLKQLVKNATIAGSGILGAAIGQAIIPVPIVGGMVGGAVTGFIAKKILDNFIEDDAKEMFRILKEEFLDTVMLAGLSSDEFKQVISLTVGHKKLPKQLQKMYQAGESRDYAREAIMMPAIKSVLAKRKKIEKSLYEKEFHTFTEELCLGSV